MKENDVYAIENPGQFIQEEWTESQAVVVALHVRGRSTSISSSGYENAEAIAYIMEQLKEQNDETSENREF